MPNRVCVAFLLVIGHKRNQCFRNRHKKLSTQKIFRYKLSYQQQSKEHNLSKMAGKVFHTVRFFKSKI